MVKKILLFLVIFIFISMTSATFQIGDLSHKIEKQYSQGEHVKGWVNFSLTEENSNSIISTNFGNSITLIDFLNRTKTSYSCSPLSCEKSYSDSNPSNSKTFTLNSANNRNKIVGIKLTGNIDSINSAAFSINSNAQASCVNQIQIDLLNDGVVDTGNNNSATSGTVCGYTKSYGCFNENQPSELFVLDAPACQRINLSESPSFEIGAFIKREKGERTLKIELFDGENLQNLGGCTLPPTLAIGQSGELSCVVEHLVTEKKEYYVCVRSEGGIDSSNVYRIRGYNADRSSSCGFIGVPSFSSGDNEELSFKIFATGRQFGNMGNVNIKDILPNGNILSHLIRDYILEQYGTLNCEQKGCLIPISFKGSSDQSVTLSNLEVTYRKAGATATTNEIYDLNEVPVKINSKFQKANLDNLSLILPDNYGNYTFEFNYNGNKMFTEKISVAQIPIINYLVPLQAPAGVMNTFYVNVSSPSKKNITVYEWDFGNGDRRITNVNLISYKYNSTGSYPLKIKVIDKDGLSASRTFNVIIGTPDAVANKTLTKKIEQLKNVNNHIKEYAPYSQEKINEKLKVSSIDSELKAIKVNLDGASTDADYIKIVQRLDKVEVPKEIYSSVKEDSLIIVPNPSNIDLNVIEDIGGGIDNDIEKEVYVNAIGAWYYENIETRISFDEISAFYENGESEKIVSIVTLDVKKKGDSSASRGDETYLVMKDFENLEFKDALNERKTSNQVYIKLEDPETSVTFSTTEEIDFFDIPAYVTTTANNLNVLTEREPTCNQNNKCEKGRGENWRNCYSDCKPYKITVWTVLGLLIFFFIAYIIMQEWYQRNYERYLFESKNFLYNILNYINQEKIKGGGDGEIETSLKKSGWNSEQIRYAMRKYYGKRTGMLEIPMDWFFNLFRSKRMPRYDRRYMPLHSYPYRRF